MKHGFLINKTIKFHLFASKIYELATPFDKPSVGWVKRSEPINKQTPTSRKNEPHHIPCRMGHAKQTHQIRFYEARFVIRLPSHDTGIVAVFHFFDGCAPLHPTLYVMVYIIN